MYYSKNYIVKNNSAEILLTLECIGLYTERIAYHLSLLGGYSTKDY